MTKIEWDASSVPELMVRALPTGRFQRELRLFAVGCVRRVWNLLPVPCRASIEVSERFATGAATEEELSQAVAAADEAAQLVLPGGKTPDARGYAASAALDASSIWPRTAANVMSATSCAAAEAVDDSRYDAVFEAAHRAELAVQAKLLRSIVTPRFE